MTETMKKMVKEVHDPKLAAFIKFFNSQGVKFVDHETKEELVPGEEDSNELS